MPGRASRPAKRPPGPLSTQTSKPRAQTRMDSATEPSLSTMTPRMEPVPTVSCPGADGTRVPAKQATASKSRGDAPHQRPKKGPLRLQRSYLTIQYRTSLSGWGDVRAERRLASVLTRLNVLVAIWLAWQGSARSWSDPLRDRNRVGLGRTTVGCRSEPTGVRLSGAGAVSGPGHEGVAGGGYTGGFRPMERNNAVSSAGYIWGVAENVLKSVHRRGTDSDPIRGLFESCGGSKPRVVEYEPDTALRDTEQVPVQEVEAGIEGFLRDGRSFPTPGTRGTSPRP